MSWNRLRQYNDLYLEGVPIQLLGSIAQISACFENHPVKVDTVALSLGMNDPAHLIL
tara:strand:- start:148 stop:318 length:171 start_codon:yes stop_codon:yes gene_type:complete